MKAAYGSRKPKQSIKSLQWFIDRIGMKIYGVGGYHFTIYDEEHCKNLVIFQDELGTRYAEFPI
jgi:hypothetical protein